MARLEGPVTPSIREVEDHIVYVRDKRVGLSIINQFASTRQQLGNYISLRFIANYETIHRTILDDRE